MKSKLPIIIFNTFLIATSAHAAEVQIFTPQGAIKDVRQVTVRFSEPMVPFGNPREIVQPFTIACSEKGTGRWADSKNWVFDFERDLAAGVNCQFTLKDELKTLSGSKIRGQKSFQFSTGGPAVRRLLAPYGGSAYVNEDQVFVLELDAKPTTESALKNVSFSIEGIQEPVGIRIITGKEKGQIIKSIGYLAYSFYSAPQQKNGRALFLIQSKQRFPSLAKVHLVWGKGIATESGVQTDQDQTFNFVTRKPFTADFSCSRENAQAACMPILPMAVQFSAPVPANEAFKSRLVRPNGKRSKPSVNEHEKNQKYVSSIIFKPPFPNNQGFKIEIPKSIKDDAGRKLSNGGKFPLAVRTDDYPPLAKFSSTFGILELHANPAAALSVRNIESDLKISMAKVVDEEEGLTGMIGKIKGKLLKVPSDKFDQILSWLAAVQTAKRDTAVLHSASVGGKIEELKIPKPNGAKAFEVMGIPLPKPGFYVLEVESQILGKALLGSTNPMYVPTAVLVTNLSVHFKWGRDSSLVWVTTLDQGEPVKNASVAIRNCKGEILWEGETDSDGLAAIEKLPRPDELPNCRQPGMWSQLQSGLFVIARAGDDMAFVHSSWNQGIEPWRFQIFTDYYNKEDLAIHTIFDRQLLRAGETVHMKHIIRKRTMDGFSLYKATFTSANAESIMIEHLGSDQKYDIPLQWDANGMAETTWAIPQDAKLGEYQVKFSGLARRYYGGPVGGSFQVQEFRVPLMKGTIQATSKNPVAPSTMTLDITVQYLAGGGASDIPIKLRRQIQPRSVSGFDGFEGYAFANGAVEQGRNGHSRSFEVKLDEEGEPIPASEDPEAKTQTLDLNLDQYGSVRTTIADLPKIDVPKDVLAEVEFRDPNGEVQTLSSRIPIWPSSRLVGIKPDSWAFSKDSLKFRVAVVNLAGKPIANAPVWVELLERKTYSHRERLIGGFYAYENFREVKKVGTVLQGQTDVAGILICNIKAPGSGNFILEAHAMDPAGHESIVHHDVWVAGEGRWWFSADNDDRMDVIPEKKQYEPGETARFQVRMPFESATALVTLEREGVIKSFIKKLNGKAPVIEVPIVGSYSPNMYVSVLAVRGRAGDVQPTALVDLGKPAFKLGIAEINVGWKAHELKVKVSSKETVYKVRETARVKIAVKSPDGSLPPPGTEVSVAAVDEGLLELAPNGSWELLKAMMQRRGDTVQTMTAQMHVIGKRHFGLKALPQGGGGGRQTTRELFDTLLLWKGTVVLNTLGEAYVEIPLNDSITSFKIAAIAIGGAGLFGTGSMSIRSTQDLMLFSGVPPVVRQGDQFKTAFTLRNATDRTMNLEVSGQVPQIQDPLQLLKLTLTPGQSMETGWNITAPVNVSSLTYLVSAKGEGAASDSIKVSQKVVPAVPVRAYQATITQLEKNYALSIERPLDAVKGKVGVNLIFQSKLSDGLESVKKYMGDYPYDCLEQMVSKAVVQRDLSLWEKMIGSLPSYLDSYGLAKYFPTCFSGSDVLTSYILAISNEAKWEIPGNLREKMIAGLRGFVDGTFKSYPSFYAYFYPADLSIRKLSAVEAMSRYGQASPKLLDSVSIEPNLWPTSAVIDWYDILLKMQGIPDQEKRLKEVEQILRSRLNFQGTIMSFSTESSDFLWWLMVSNDVNAVRALFPLLENKDWKEDVPRLVRGALQRQRKGSWDTTVANAWGVLAMEKFSDGFEKVPVGGRTQARISNETRSVDWKANPKTSSLFFTISRQKQDLSVLHMGDGKPWLTVQSLAAIPLKVPLATGYRITKKITAVSQKSPGTWSRGDVARVTLNLESQADMTWVVVNDPVPAGSAILGTGLGRDSQILAQGEKREGWAWPAFEERSFESYRSYFEYVPKGKWTVEYTVRFNNEGTFHLPTTRVEALYNPEMFGESPNKDITILQ